MTGCLESNKPSNPELRGWIGVFRESVPIWGGSPGMSIFLPPASSLCAVMPHAEAPGRKGQPAAAPSPALCSTSAMVPEGMRPP